MLQTLLSLLLCIISVTTVVGRENDLSEAIALEAFMDRAVLKKKGYDLVEIREILKNKFEGRKLEELQEHLLSRAYLHPYKIFCLLYDEYFSFEVFVPKTENIVKYRCGGVLDENGYVKELWFSRGFIYSTVPFCNSLESENMKYTILEEK